MARPIEPGRLFRNGPSDDMECDPEHRMAGLAGGARHVVADRVGRSRAIVTSQIGTSVMAAGAAHPQLARDDRALAERETPIGGRRLESDGTASDVWLVVEAFSRTDGKRLWEHRAKATGFLPAVHEKHNLATPTPVTDGERIYAWFGNGQMVALDMEGRAGLDAPSRHRVRAVSDTVGARELAGTV